MEPTKAYIFGLSAAALASLGAWLYTFGVAFDWTALWGTAVLALLCALAQRFPVSFTRGAVEIVDVVVLVSIILFGPVWALVAALPSVIYRDALRTQFVASGEVVMILAAGSVFYLFASPLAYGAAFDASFVYGVLAASAVYYAADIIVNSTLMRIKHGVPFAENIREFFLPVIPSDVAAALAALGTAYATFAFGPAAALVLFAGAGAALISLHLIHGYQRESEALRAGNASLLSSSTGFAAGIVESIGEKDGYTARLAAASSVFAGDVAGEFGLDAERTEKLRVAALLQDVGMVGVPDEVLVASPEKLNSVGRRQLERHTLGSERILSGAPGFEEAARWVRWHHERADGTGYPDRLKGQWIPLESRILAVAETYSSLVLDAPHSPALSPRDARFELTNLAERSLDAEVVKSLLRVLDREDENYASAADDRFAFTNPSKADEDGSTSLRIV